MVLSIRAKLFVALVAASLIATLGTAAFVRWSFEQGLRDLLSARESARVAEIADRLAALYARDGSWDRLKEDKRLWVATLMGRGHWPSDARGGPRPRPAPPWLRRGLGGPGVWPPDHAIERLAAAGAPPLAGARAAGSAAETTGGWDGDRSQEGRTRHLDLDLGRGRDDPDAPDDAGPAALPRGRGRALPVELRLMLLDASGRPVYAREALLPGTRRIPIEQDGRILGTLALIPGPPLAELPELQLRARQGRHLWIIALAVLTVSAALSWLLARRLVRPLGRFQAAARRLAAGDYSARVELGGKDELARLGRDIDALGAALARHDEARRRWVADIAHELRTPIALMRAELEAIQDGVRQLDRARVDALHGDVLRLHRLVDDLHVLTVTDLGAPSLQLAPTDLAQVLEADLEALSPRFAANRIALTFEDRRGPPQPSRSAPAGISEPVKAPFSEPEPEPEPDSAADLVAADPARLSQVFRNLLRNSLQYTDPGGALRVSLSRDGEALAIDFEDSPPGVPDEALPRLFDRLYRVEGSRSRHTGGAGLGLAIVRNIVEAHGGRVRAAHSRLGGLWIRVELRAG